MFVYGKSAKSCYLYTRADLSPNKDFDSGIRNSLVEPVNQASSIGSTALFTIRNGSEATGVADGGAVYVSSIGECEQKCARAATCKVFAYGKKARSCYLYMRADFSPNADFDSGVRK